MNEQECLSHMIPPSRQRPNKPLGGVIQIHVTRQCDKTCFNCTQGSNLGGKVEHMPVALFEQAVLSLKDYWGVVGVFGGNPALVPWFTEYCEVLRTHIPKTRCGLWCNHPVTPGKAQAMRSTFNPQVSNLNVHLDSKAYAMFKAWWPESNPFGLMQDSRHSPCYVAMKDLGILEEQRWSLISNCDINQHWSAMIGMFRGELRAWFCEIAGAQSMLHQHDPDYPDTGLPVGEYLASEPAPTLDALDNIYRAPVRKQWWELHMRDFAHQVRKHCHECGVPLRGHGELACASDDTAKEQVSITHQDVYTPKRPNRRVELVTVPSQLGEPLGRMTDYLGNGKK